MEWILALLVLTLGGLFAGAVIRWGLKARDQLGRRT